MQSFLATVIRELNTLFEPGDSDLAYLALTGKVEHHVRDRLACRLNAILESKSVWLVAREWKSRDLAIFDGPRLAFALEAKAGFAFDLVRPPKKTNDFTRLIEDDLRKVRDTCQKNDQAECEMAALLIIVNPLAVIDPEYGKHLKYLSRKNAERELRTSAALNVEVLERVKGMQMLKRGKWVAGSAFRVPVEVCFWLFRASEA